MKRIVRKKFLFNFIIFLLSIFIINKAIYGIISFFSNNKYLNISDSSLNNVEYETIKLDYNSNYSGIGQKNILNKDGYFTTFTDISGKVYIEYKQNGNSSWANKNYWDGDMKDTGCGITAISVILSAYGFNITPEDLREKYYPVLNGEKISSEFTNNFGIKNSDFLYDSVSLSEKKITEHLKENKPVLICVWNKPSKNRWTTSSHYMVLLAADDNQMVYVSNPNRIAE